MGDKVPIKQRQYDSDEIPGYHGKCGLPTWKRLTPADIVCSLSHDNPSDEVLRERLLRFMGELAHLLPSVPWQEPLRS